MNNERRNKRNQEASQTEEKEKKQRTVTSRRNHIYLHEDFLLMEILTRLPAKSLYRFKAVCGLWHQDISSNFEFARMQAKRESAMSSAMIYDDAQTLKFLYNSGKSVGLPASFLEIEGGRNFHMIASTHGLLLLLVYVNRESYFYVCNPVTGEGERIPKYNSYLSSCMGLAYNPSISPDQYTIIRAHRWQQPTKPAQWRRPVKDSMAKYTFEIFSSKTASWTKSSAKEVWVNSSLRPDKAVFAGGVLYWYAGGGGLFWYARGEGLYGRPAAYILTYNVSNNSAEIMMPPPSQFGRCEEEIGTWGELLTCTRSTKEGIEVWVLRKHDEWEMKLRVYMEEIIWQNHNVFSTFWHMMLVRNRPIWEGLQQRHQLIPVPYDGGKNIYLRIHVKEKGWKMKRVIVACDKETKKAEILSVSYLENRHWRQSFFSYHNSLTPLPRVDFATIEKK